MNYEQQQASWLVAKDAKITARSCNYEAAYWQYIKTTYEGKLTSWTEFDAAKTMIHKCEKLDIWVDFVEWAQANVEFLNSRLQTPNVLSLMRSMVNAITSKFNGYMDSNNLSLMTLEAFKFILPVVPGGSQRQIPWLFERPGAEAVERMNWLMFPLTEKLR